MFFNQSSWKISVQNQLSIEWQVDCNPTSCFHNNSNVMVQLWLNTLHGRNCHFANILMSILKLAQTFTYINTYTILLLCPFRTWLYTDSFLSSVNCHDNLGEDSGVVSHCLIHSFEFRLVLLLHCQSSKFGESRLFWCYLTHIWIQEEKMDLCLF